MKKNTNTIDYLRKSLNESSKPSKRLTLKEMIYDDEYEQYEDGPGYENVSSITPKIDSEPSQENAPIDKPLQNEMAPDPEIVEMLSKIRLSVINGLAKLANKPENSYYDLLKKLLQLVDKPIEMANKDRQ